MAADQIQIEIGKALEDFRFEQAGLEYLLQVPVVQDLVKRAIRVESRAKESMGRVAPPSAPGQPPAVRTGRLRGSITWRIGRDAVSPYVDVGTAVAYGLFLEEGTRRMRARPYLRPALEAARATI